MSTIKLGKSAIQSSKIKKEKLYRWGTIIAHSRFCIGSSFFMEFSCQKWSFECWSLRVVVLSKFGSYLELKIHGERDCVLGSNVLFKIHQRSMCFTTGWICVCNCRIPEVPASSFPIQLMLESLEVSGNSWGSVRSRGGFHPLGCAGWGEESWWTRIRCEFYY